MKKITSSSAEGKCLFSDLGKEMDYFLNQKIVL